jgi:hypothetical protein
MPMASTRSSVSVRSGCTAMSVPRPCSVSRRLYRITVFPAWSTAAMIALPRSVPRTQNRAAGGRLKFCDLQVLGEQLPNEDPRVWSPSGVRLLQQLAEHDLGLMPSLGRFAVAQPAAGQRVSARIHADAVRAAR